MPSLIFDHNDIVMSVDEWQGGITPVMYTGSSGNNAITFTNNNIGDFGFSGISSETIAQASAGLSPNFSKYIKVGSLAASYAARIPATARITSYKVRIDVSCNCQVTVTGTTASIGNLVFNLPSAFGTEPPSIHSNLSDLTGPINLLKVANYTAPDSETTISFTGFAAGYATRAYLINNHASAQARLEIDYAFGGISNLDVGTATTNVAMSVNHWSVTITYGLPPTQWTISQATAPVEPEDPGPPVVPGSTITITSPEPAGDDSLDMSQITSVTIRYLDGSTVPVPEFVAFDPFTFEFDMPVFDPDQPVLYVDVLSTQFSGSLDLGPIPTIAFNSASGLYQLDFEATHDTLYIEDDLPNTIDVKIPNPTIKTGFIDG